MLSNKTVLITGGAGSIGRTYANHLGTKVKLKLLDLPGMFSDMTAPLDAELIEVDLADLNAIRRHYDGVDIVIHLAGERKPSALWQDLLPANIIGLYNSVIASIDSRVQHFVYASSVHTVSGGSRRLGIQEDVPVQPADLYGVTKCFGEALGYYAAHSHQLKFTALRIGAFQESEVINNTNSGWMLLDYCSHFDLCRMIDAVITEQTSIFSIYNAVSRNTFSRLSMDKAIKELGFSPEADSFMISAAFQEAIQNVGGLADKPAESGLRADLTRE